MGGITIKPAEEIIGTIDFGVLILQTIEVKLVICLHQLIKTRDHERNILNYYTFMVLTDSKLHSIEANVNPENIASKTLLEHHGFIQEAYFRENYFYNGQFLDSLIFCLLKEDFPSL